MSRDSRRALNRAFEEALESLTQLSQEKVVSDIELYRAEVKRVAYDLKDGAVALAISGHQDGLLLLGKLPKTLMECIKTWQPFGCREVMLDTLSDCFPFNSTQFYQLCRMNDRGDLRVKAFLQALTQESSPGDILCTKMDELPDDRFMECWLKVLGHMVPSMTEIDPDALHKPFQSFHKHVRDRGNISGAAEFFAAHLDYLRPFLRYMLDNSTVEGLRLVREESPEKPAPEGIATIGHVTRFRNALGFSGEFLHNLYGLTQDPIVLEVAEVAIRQPSGFRPYEFFEVLGIARDRAWHLAEQVKSNGMRLVKLYEHAICMDGLELEVSKVRHDKLIAENPEVRDMYLELFRTVPLQKPSVLRKAQVLMDAFVDHCRIHENGRLQVSFVEGRLPPILFAKHNKWLSQQFINELGV